MALTFDPLNINLAKQKRVLLALLPPNSTHIQQIAGANTPARALDTLSHLLAAPALTLTIADLFRPLLIDLCARWLHNDDDIEDRFIAFCLLIELHEELYPCLYAFLQKPCLSKGPLAFIAAAPSVTDIDTTRLHRMLLAYYRLLHTNRLLPKHLLWDGSLLSKLLFPPHPDEGVKLFAARCYASHVGMAEVEREKLITHVLGEFCGVDCPVNYGQTIDGTIVETDGWLVPTLEVKRIHDARDAILEGPNFYSLEEGDVSQPLSEADLSPWIANIYGILMLKSSPTPPSASNMIATPSAISALGEIAAHLSLRLPILLSSPPSSGKSLFISHLASNLHPTTPVNELIVTIHLADTSLDPRALLGSYISSPTRLGTFEWKDGVLVRALREGRWLVLSDIDRASMEVLGLLKPLIESMGLGNWIGHRAGIEVPGKGRIEAREGFALFATRSLAVGHGKKVPPPTFFGSHKWHEVMVAAPDAQEVKAIMESRFPTILGATVAFIRLWADVRALGSTSSSRPVGLRELEKFCQRVERLLPSSQRMDVDMDTDTQSPLSNIFPNPSLREDIFLEARDVFFGAGTLTASARAHSAQISSLIGAHLDLDAERQEWLLQRHTADFALERDVNGDVLAAHCGRTRLLARPVKGMSTGASSRPFALHKPALSLLSRISTALALSEPVLLTGETGTGKTSAVTYLASLLRRPLISLNLSQQTEASDLLGGFRPVDARVRGSELMEQWSELFGGTFSRKRNAGFEDSVRKAVREGRWKRAVGMWKESGRMARERIRGKVDGEVGETNSDAPRKRRKVEAEMKISEADWESFEKDVDEFDLQHAQGNSKFTFDFVEGPLVKALRAGDWILLDEINLASPETLECITSLLRGPTASITLTEQGSLAAIPRHPDFRLFACMNPATDVGKKDLPPAIRARFTEIDVPPPDADRETLLSIVSQYIGASAVGDKGAVMDVAEFYISVKSAELADGSNKKPHYSMRTLARALTFASDIAGMFGIRRALWEGMLMAFTMVLDGGSAETVTDLAQKHILAGVRNPRSLLGREPNLPPGRSVEEFIKFGPFYIEKGPLPEDPVEEYIMTPSVEKKLVDLARIVLTRRFPVLIEGPTSAGKTSAVEYLARRTGHRFIRINNHEHTDVQEYLGSYVSDPATGKLVFKDGLLVHALRHGHWIVLDELNLAPTDVLEALNRLLDDNRELVVPETQEVIRPHPHFMLFATQNPPGLYAGRKVLSRAFRNRFLEVHFQDVPQAELETILCQRCRIAPSYGQKIVGVFRELQKRRQSGRVFESKQGFATLRDLFRWAGRDAVGYQELAENGYMLLAERARREDDKLVVKEVIESIMKVRIDEQAIYDIHSRSADAQGFLGCPIPMDSQVVWTSAMQRLFVLVSRALRFNEPVLLVGETGSGKTSVCQVFAEVASKGLYTLSCHQNTETADLIGGLRPVRNRASTEANIVRDANAILERASIDNLPSDAQQLLSRINTLLKTVDLDPSLLAPLRDIQENLNRVSCLFEWHDGPLVRAMRGGDVFLLDEISLADDSVLERLNSVLEPGRTIVLAERGGIDGDYPAIQASDMFKLLATMNPGGDYGKKELSPALRNRFTEIWVPAVTSQADLQLIVDHSWKCDSLRPFTAPLLQFTNWLRDRVRDTTICSLRDMLAWVAFANAACSGNAENSMLLEEIFHHATHMTFLDGLGSLPQLSSYSSDALSQLRNDAIAKLHTLVPYVTNESSYAFDASNFVQLGSFAIPKGPLGSVMHNFNLQAPTARENAMRVVRACQVPKPVLLEGSPGVGKTSLITTLAMLSGYQLCRINLSDQTDLIDLFGSDLPVENGSPGEFAWKDAEFLTAMQEGHWLLLDEMNLAPQAILEGLNAVLDHRGTVYIPELGRSFVRHPAFRVFAAQNPLQQGGGRKGLPKSFLDRFTKVYIEELSPEDLLLVCRERFNDCDEDILRAMITYNNHLNQEVIQRRTFGRDGSPWEFNLRDVLRWGELLQSSPISHHPRDFLRVIYLSRFRTLADRDCAQHLFDQAFSLTTPTILHNPYPILSSSYVRIGHYIAKRSSDTLEIRSRCLLQAHLAALEAIGACLSRSWLVILTGRHDSGKSELIRTVADLSGNVLREITITSSTDTMDILGGFEQTDHRTRVLALVQDIISFAESRSRRFQSCTTEHQSCLSLLLELRSFPSPSSSSLHSAAQVLSTFAGDETCSNEANALLRRVQRLSSMVASSGQFEWVDGPLVRAIKRGHWVVLDGANLCNPSVLDRLNSLCEPGGVLVLSERGYVNNAVETLKPHPNFRLFMTSDPRYGELSRAMRNRGIEVSLAVSFSSEDELRIRLHHRLPRTVSSTDRPLALTYELTRRGIYSSQRVEGSDLWPSGLIGEESSTSSLITLAPFLRPVKPDLRAMIHFILRTISFNVTPLLQRYMKLERPLSQSQSILDDAFSSEALKLFAEWREDLLSRVTSNVISALPMDAFMVCPPCKFCSHENDHHPTHLMLLQTLNLIAAIFIDNTEQKAAGMSPGLQGIGTINMAIATRQQQPTSLRLFDTVNKVLEEVHRAAEEVFNQAVRRSHVQLVDLELALKFLSISRQLRQAGNETSVDHSSIQACSMSINVALQSRSSTFDRLASFSTMLDEAVSPTSGLGLTEMWTHLFAPKTIEISLTEIRGLAYAAGQPYEGSNQHARRRQILEVLSLCTLPLMSPVTASFEMAGLAPMVKKITLNSHGGIVAFNRHVDPSLLICELPLLCTIHEASSSPSTVPSAMKCLVDVACEEPHEDLTRFASYQHFVWAHDAGEKVPMYLLTALQTGWLASLWDARCNLADTLEGPDVLLCPTLLRVSAELNQARNVSLSSVKGHEASIRRHLRLLSMQCIVHESRVQQLSAFMCQTILSIASCFASSFDDISWQAICGSLVGNNAAFPMTTLSVLENSKHEPFRVAIQLFLRPAVTQFAAHQQSRDMMACLGHCYISLARVIIDLSIPDLPIDPAAVINRLTEYSQEETKFLSTQSSLHRLWECRTAGNLSNDIIRYLDVSSEGERKNLPQGSSSLPRRDGDRIHAFWSEVSQLRSQVIQPSKVDNLIALLETGDPSAFTRESVVQESISGFCQRMDNLYHDFEDIAKIIRLALLLLRLGIRLVRCSTQQRSYAQDQNMIVTSLVAYPSVHSAQLLHTQLEQGSGSGASPSDQVLLHVSAIALQAIVSGIAPHAAAVHTAYEQAFRLWTMDRTRQDEKEHGLSSLYKQKALDHDASTEVEAEQREFLELFPTFEDALANPDGIPNRIHEKHSELFGVSAAEALLNMHFHLTGVASVSVDVEDPNMRFRLSRQSVLKTLLDSRYPILPEILDRESLHEQFSLLHDHLLVLTDRERPTKQLPNFYTDANIREAKKALAMVDSLRMRLVALVEEWPDQMVLQQLKDRCDAFLALDLKSPIAKLLSALEQTVLHTEDWEMYAHRGNSLKAHQQALTTLIVEWRRLELSCWQVLLQSQFDSFVKGVAEFWFRLYDVLLRGPLGAVNEDESTSTGALQQYLRQLPSLLDDFLRSSTLGQFQVRLDLLKSFGVIVDHIAPTLGARQCNALQRVRLILASTWRYYRLFAGQLAGSLADQRGVLEKDVQAFIKLASWKDVNVQALKQSAQRTHHQLYKLIRRFREILRQPISERMLPTFAGEAESSQSIDSSGYSGEPLSGAQLVERSDLLQPNGTQSVAPSHLVNLSQTFARFHGLMNGRVRAFLRHRLPHHADQLAVEIIITARDLAAECVPPGLSKEKRQKYIKGLLVRKKKALSDLLKELKRAGLAANVKPEVLAELRDDCWIREQPWMPLESLIPVEKGEYYFDRLRGALPAVRVLLSDHHSDISTRDLSRGITFVESGYSFALKARSSLSTAVQCFADMKRCGERLQKLVEAPLLVTEACSPTRLAHLCRALGNAVHAFEELLQGIHVFIEIQEDRGAAPSVMDEVQSVCTKTRLLRDRVSEIFQGSHHTMPRVLLEVEYAAVKEADEHHRTIPDYLQKMKATEPRLSYILSPAEHWLRDQYISTEAEPTTSVVEPLGADAVIETLLVTMQSLLKRCPEVSTLEHPDEETQDNFIREDLRTVSSFTQSLDLEALSERLNVMTTYISSLPQADIQVNLRRLLPFLNCYIAFVREHLIVHSQWIKALFKLDFIVCSVMHTIAKQGFCLPPEATDSGEGEDSTETADGVGLGEGVGTENVSKEIEDESQVEGLKGDDDKAPDGQEHGADDNTIEMSEDIGGDMEDVPDDGEQEKDDDEEEQEGPDEQLGKVDAGDPNAVDEKLWGDESAEADSADQDQVPQDRSETQKESEVVAKEGSQSKKEDGKKEEDKADGKMAESEEVQEAGDENEGEEPEADLEPPNANGAPMDEYIPDANTLDLPDDMNLEPEEKEDQGVVEMGDDMDEGLDEDEQETDRMEEIDQSGTNESPEDVLEPQSQENQPSDQPPHTADDADMAEEDAEEGAVAQPDVSSGNGETGNQDNQDNQPSASDTAQQGQVDGASGDAKDDAAETDQNAKKSSEESGPRDDTESQKPWSSSPTDAALEAGTSAEGAQHGRAKARQHTELATNPIRNLGDALKEVQQRFEEILGGDESSPPVADHAAEQVEYADADEEMQALGPAGEEQVAKLNQLRLVDEQIEAAALPMDIDAPIPDEFVPPSQTLASLHAEPTTEGARPDIEGAISQMDLDRGAELEHVSSRPDPSSAEVDVDEDMEQASPDTSFENIEAALRTWQDSGYTFEAAESLWRLYTSLTHDLSYALCEQLRLILAPTLATRLKGDYRTGKRLSMKKIIPYIASDYTKDKIWLRRTRPSQREYQVLLALDDSRSMASSRSVHLAYQTLALVSNAMGKLEVGDIAIARFGEGMELLHGFDEGPFTDAAGAKTLGAFKFEQRATNVLDLVETSLGVLESARERRATGSSSAGELWQLEIIISDGICQDHERLRQVLRRAASQRVMIVFIIIDALHSTSSSGQGQAQDTSAVQNSIVSMNQVAYTMVNGKMELQVERYLDSFPFDYYVVLRSVEALPEVLSDTLRQFFERISEE